MCLFVLFCTACFPIWLLLCPAFAAPQLNAGVLDDQQALRLVNGLAGPVPLPRLQGMSVPRGIDLPAHLLPPGTPGAPAAAPGAAAPQRPAPPAPPAAQASPARPAPAMPPASPPPAAAGGAFPPLSAEQAAAYQTAFSQLDTDRDGFVQVGLLISCGVVSACARFTCGVVRRGVVCAA